MDAAQDTQASSVASVTKSPAPWIIKVLGAVAIVIFAAAIAVVDGISFTRTKEAR